MSKQNIIDDINEKIIGASEANSISPSVLGDILLDTINIIPAPGTGGGTFDEVLEAGNTTNKSFYHRSVNEFIDIKSGVMGPENSSDTVNVPFVGIEMKGVGENSYLSSMGFFAGEGVAIRRQSFSEPDKDGEITVQNDYFYFPRLKPDGTPLGGSPIVVEDQIMDFNGTDEELSASELEDSYPDAIDGFKVYCPSITTSPSGKKRVYMKAAQDWVKSYVTLADEDDSAAPGSFDGLSATVINIETDVLNSDDEAGILQYLNESGLELPTDGTYVIEVTDTVYANKFVYNNEWDMPSEKEVRLYVGSNESNTEFEANLTNYKKKGKYITFDKINYVTLGTSQNNGNIYADKIKEMYASSNTVSRGFLSGMSNLERVILPEILVANGSGISGPKLKYVSLDKCTYLGSSGIANCPELEEVNLPELQTLSGSGLGSNPKLKKIILPKAIEINSARFTGCTGLEEVRIPMLSDNNGGYFDMYGCTSLKIVEMNAFTGVPSGFVDQSKDTIEEIYLNSMPAWKNGSGNDYPRLKIFEGNSMLGMESSATLKGTRLTELSLPLLKYIRNSSRISNNIYLSSLNIPSLERIHSTTNGIDGNHSLTALTLASLKYLWSGGNISNNNRLSELNLPELIVTDGSGGVINNPKLVNLNIPKWDCGKAIDYSNTTDTDVVTIDALQNGSSGYFYNNPLLTIFTAPATRLIKGSTFFDGNNSIKSNIEEFHLNNVLTIMDITGSYFNDLKVIFAPKAQLIRGGGISGVNIVNLDLPKLSTLSDGAISSNDLLETVNLPELTSYGGAGVSNCPSLVTLNLGPLLVNADQNVNGCPLLETITCPNLVTMPGALALPSLVNFVCPKLKSIEGLNGTKISNFNFPALTSIPGGFSGSQNPTRFYLPVLLALEDTAFDGISGHTIALTLPTALGSSPAVVTLQANNTVTLTLV